MASHFVKKILIPFLLLITGCSGNQYLQLECKNYDPDTIKSIRQKKYITQSNESYEKKELKLNVYLNGDKVKAEFFYPNGKTIFVKGKKYFSFYDPIKEDFPRSDQLPKKGFININLMDYQNYKDPKGTNYITVSVDDNLETWHFTQMYRLSIYDKKHPDFDKEKYERLRSLCSSEDYINECSDKNSFLNKAYYGKTIQTGKCSREYLVEYSNES